MWSVLSCEALLAFHYRYLHSLWNSGRLCIYSSYPVSYFCIHSFATLLHSNFCNTSSFKLLQHFYIQSFATLLRSTFCNNSAFKLLQHFCVQPFKTLLRSKFFNTSAFHFCNISAFNLLEQHFFNTTHFKLSLYLQHILYVLRDAFFSETFL